MTSATDFDVLKESLVAAARGPFFPDWEFSSLFGLERSEVEVIADSFLPSTPMEDRTELALQNAVNNLLGYPHQQAAAWAQWLSVTPSELQAVYSRWQAVRNEA